MIPAFDWLTIIFVVGALIAQVVSQMRKGGADDESLPPSDPFPAKPRKRTNEPSSEIDDLMEALGLPSKDPQTAEPLPPPKPIIERQETNVPPPMPKQSKPYVPTWEAPRPSAPPKTIERINFEAEMEQERESHHAEAEIHRLMREKSRATAPATVKHQERTAWATRLKNPRALREIIVGREILGPPVGAR